MPTSVSTSKHDAEHRGRDEVFGGVDVAGQPHDHVAGLPLLVERQRQPLHVVIEQVPQVVADALGRPSSTGTSRCTRLTAPTSAMTTTATPRRRAAPSRSSADRQPARRASRATGFDADHVVEDDLERPRLEQIGGARGDHRPEGSDQPPPVRAQKLRPPQVVHLGALLRRSRAVRRPATSASTTGRWEDVSSHARWCATG